MTAIQRAVVDKDTGNINVHGRSGLELVWQVRSKEGDLLDLSDRDLVLEVGGWLRVLTTPGEDAYSRRSTVTREQMAALPLDYALHYALHDESVSPPCTLWSARMIVYGFNTAPAGGAPVTPGPSSWSGATITVQQTEGPPTIVVTHLGATGYFDPTTMAALNSADVSLETRISAEEGARAAADSSLETHLSTEGATRSAADTSLTTRLSTEEAARSTADTSIVTRFSTADTSLTTRVSTEEATRSTADTSLTTRISTEEVSRATADTSLTTRLSNEEVTRAAAATSLTTRLSTEEVARSSADTSLATVDVSISSALSTQEANMLAGRFGIDLDFTTNAYAVNGSRASTVATIPNITVTRASAGYAETIEGTLTAFSSGEARRTNKGLLIEEARTNLCLQSQTFQTAWSAVLTTVAADQTTAPDGTMTADKLTPTVMLNQHRIDQTTSIPAAPHTFSVYVKAAGYGFVWLRIGSVGAVFNLSTGAATTVSGGATAYSVQAANGWWRCVVSCTTLGSDTVRINVSEGPTAADFSGDGTSGIFVWGAQLEAASTASSYIVTTSASATRAADVISVGGLAVAAPLTLVTGFEAAQATSGTKYIAQLDAGTQNNVLLNYLSGTMARRAYVTASGVAQADVNAGVNVAVGAQWTMAGLFQTNNVNAAASGTLGAADTSATMPTGLVNLRLGSTSVGAAQANGYIRRVVVYPRALTNAELQAVTT